MNPRALVTIQRGAVLMALVAACGYPSAARGQSPALRMVSPWDQRVVQVGAAPWASAMIRPVAFNQPAPTLAQEGGMVAPDFGPEGALELGSASANGPLMNDAIAGDGWGPCDLCPPSWYVTGAYALFQNNTAETATGSNAVRLSDFDYEHGLRVTLGRMFDCTEGWEGSYVGPFRWSDGISINDPSGSLQSNFIFTDLPAEGLVPAEVSAFNDATYHGLLYTSKLNSFEFGKKSWGWDVFAVTWGVRYIHYTERFIFLSQNAQGQRGALNTRTRNDLIGPQLSLDFRYPFLPAWSVASTYKGALMANFDASRTRLDNAGARILDNGKEDLTWSLMGELRGQLTRHFGRQAAAYVACELWYINHMALAPEQTPRTLLRSLGSKVEDKGEIWLSGFTAGFEFSW